LNKNFKDDANRTQ
jgi:hypothetical protein